MSFSTRDELFKIISYCFTFRTYFVYRRTKKIIRISILNNELTRARTYDTYCLLSDLFEKKSSTFAFLHSQLFQHGPALVTL